MTKYVRFSRPSKQLKLSVLTSNVRFYLALFEMSTRLTTQLRFQFLCYCFSSFLYSLFHCRVFGYAIHKRREKEDVIKVFKSRSRRKHALLKWNAWEVHKRAPRKNFKDKLKTANQNRLDFMVRHLWILLMIWLVFHIWY